MFVHVNVVQCLLHPQDKVYTLHARCLGTSIILKGRVWFNGYKQNPIKWLTMIMNSLRKDIIQHTQTHIWVNIHTIWLTQYAFSCIYCLSYYPDDRGIVSNIWKPIPLCIVTDASEHVGFLCDLQNVGFHVSSYACPPRSYCKQPSCEIHVLCVHQIHKIKLTFIYFSKTVPSIPYPYDLIGKKSSSGANHTVHPHPHPPTSISYQIARGRLLLCSRYTYFFIMVV